MGPEMLQMGLVASQLTGSFGAVVDRVVTNPWLRSFLDLECFVLSGMTARDTLCAEMAFMFEERNSGRSAIEYPVGGEEGRKSGGWGMGLGRGGGQWEWHVCRFADRLSGQAEHWEAGSDLLTCWSCLCTAYEAGMA
ncbi:predicted protein [Haematococcus lacustris]|uniref:Uncharacterized protein n=1 Tax=Haematococcus lacustris TaxID=44745 RepID=A0A699YQF3_HAELA|nr:predicted protein [Haematococcus lacustris]